MRHRVADESSQGGAESASYLPIIFDIPPAIYQLNSFILARILNTPDGPIYTTFQHHIHNTHGHSSTTALTTCAQISTPAAATGALLCRQPITTAVVES